MNTRRIRLSLAVVLLLLACFFAACAKRAPQYTPPPVSYLSHVVTYQGETLGLIARWYTGRTENWTLLLDHNPGLDVRRMRPGTLISIPRDMLITEENMPSSFVQRAAAKAADESAQQQASAPTMGEVAANPIAAPEKILPEAGMTAPPQVEPVVDQAAAEAEAEAEAAMAAAKAAEEEAARAVQEAEAQKAQQAAESGATKSRDELLRELLDEGQ